MNSRDYFKDIYKDFFGVESLSVNKEIEEDIIEKGRQEEMTTLFDRTIFFYTFTIFSI